MDGAPAGTSAMPRLVAAIERAKKLANSATDVADQLHNQADRLLGSRPPEPQSATNGALIGKPDGGPLVHQIEEVLETLSRNLARVSAGANRMNELG